MLACCPWRHQAILSRWPPAHAALVAAIWNRRKVSWITPSRTCSKNLAHLSTEAPPSNKCLTLQVEVINLLHKTSTFLPHVLPPTPNTNVTTSLEFWISILDDARKRLISVSDKQGAHIVVCEVDEWSGSRELVIGLLEAPFEEYGAIRSILTPDHTASITLDASSSPLLGQFPVPTRLTKLVPLTQTSATVPDLTTLFSADIPVIVCNPASTHLRRLFLSGIIPCYNEQTILVISSGDQLPPMHSVLGNDQSRIARCVVEPKSLHEDLEKLKVLSIDPVRAASAQQVLKSDPTSSIAVHQYQSDFTGSNIFSLTDSLKVAFASLDPTNAHSSLNTRHTLTQIKGALRACYTSLIEAKGQLDLTYAAISELQREVEQMQAKALYNTVGLSADRDGSTSVVEVVDLDRSRQQVRAVMDRLTWWRLVTQVDDINILVGTAVDKAWHSDLEAKLQVHTGLLMVIQEKLTSLAFTLISTAPLSSPILRNSLLQITSRPSFALTPASLTSPLYVRKSQVIKYLTTRLQVVAQRVVLGVSSSIFAGAVVSWTGWVGWLAGSSQGVLGLFSMDATTSMGVGALIALGGVRLAVGRWEKAKKRWWEDWARVNKGLSRDLKATLEERVKKNVVVVANTAASGLLELANKRKSQLSGIEDELDSLNEELNQLQQRYSTQLTSNR